MSNAPSIAMTNGLTYRQSGVDIAAGDALVKAIGPLAAATRRPGAEPSLGGFGGLFDLKAAGFNDPVLVASTDGVGTKLKIAVAADRHDTVGIDLVAMCVNDIAAQGAEPLFFLDYFATGKLDAGVAEAVIAGIARGCREAGCALIGGETAERPGMYEAGEYDLAGFAVGAAERGMILPRDDVVPGDVLVALASSGIHSNGFSLVRRIVDEAGLGPGQPAPFAHDGSTLGEALLVPTRIYARATRAATSRSAGVKALAHITGGGITGNLPRVMPEGTRARIDLGELPRLPVFGWLAHAGGVTDDEMLATFNCGVGMIAVVDADTADEVITVLAASGEHAAAVGTVEAGSGPATVVYDDRPWWTA